MMETEHRIKKIFHNEKCQDCLSVIEKKKKKFRDPYNIPSLRSMVDTSPECASKMRNSLIFEQMYTDMVNPLDRMRMAQQNDWVDQCRHIDWWAHCDGRMFVAADTDELKDLADIAELIDKHLKKKREKTPLEDAFKDTRLESSVDILDKISRKKALHHLFRRLYLILID